MEHETIKIAQNFSCNEILIGKSIESEVEVMPRILALLRMKEDHLIALKQI